MALTKEDLQAIQSLLEPIQKDVKDVKKQVGDVQKQVEDVQQQVEDVQKQVKDVQKQVEDVQKQVEDVQQEVKDTKQETKDIKLTLENETNRNIKIIAEGHLDISRRLDKALKVENEKEMLLIRVNILENELRKVKEKINNIA